MTIKSKAIPLSGGLITIGDQEELDANYSTDLVNVDLTNPGVLRIRAPFGDSIPLNFEVEHLYRWVDKIQEIGHKTEPTWIAVVPAEKYHLSSINTGWFVLMSSGGTGWLELIHFTQRDVPTRVLDLGGSLRLIRGWGYPSIFIDQINRKFFNNAMSFNGIYVDNNIELGGGLALESATAISGGNLDDGSAGTDTVYHYYKVAPVFDGTQIGALADQFPKKISVANGGSNKTAELVMNIDKRTWNPRTTAINIYRGSLLNVDNHEAVTYRLVKSVRTTTNIDIPNNTFGFWGARRTASLGVSDLDTLTYNSYGNTSIKGNGDRKLKSSQSTDLHSTDRGDYLWTGIKQPDNLSTSTDFAGGATTFKIAKKTQLKYTMRMSHAQNNTHGRCTIIEVDNSPGVSNSDGSLRARSSGSHWRYITAIKKDVVWVNTPFWREDINGENEFLDEGSSESVRKKGNYRWSGGGNPSYYNAITTSVNSLKCKRHIKHCKDVY